MISIDTALFNRIAPILRKKFKGVSVYGEYVASPASFPHVSIVEADNSSDVASMPLSRIPAAANLLYEINVYSNKTSGRKTEADSIMSVIDEQMQDMGFIRTFKNPVSNLENATIYRIVARYTKKQDRGGI